jgi:sulfur carrier protein
MTKPLQAVSPAVVTSATPAKQSFSALHTCLPQQRIIRSESSPTAMIIKVNGDDREISEGTTVRALVATFNLTPEKVAIELNRRLIRSEKYDQPLKPGDEIEIVTFVGGG